MRNRTVMSAEKARWSFTKNFRIRNQPALKALWLTLVAALLFLATPAAAGVSISVQAGQPGFPINVFVSVTDGDDPLPGLGEGDFDIRIGSGDPLTPTTFVSRAAEQDQRLSVVFVMDFTTTITIAGALDALKNATKAYAASLQPGDYAAIVKFNDELGANVILAFSEILDEGTTLADSIDAPYVGSGTNAFDALRLALRKFDTTEAELPEGPKAVIHVSDGEDNASEVNKDFVVALAQGLGIRIFTIGLGDINEDDRIDQGWLDNMLDLANLTGGRYFDATANPDEAIEDAYKALSILLQSEYILTLDSGVNNCREQTLTVLVDGQEATTTFSHIGCLPSSSGGGGGSFGLLGLFAGLSLLALRRRLGLV